MAAQHIATTGRTFTGLHEHDNTVEDFQLKVGEVRSLERRSQVLRVVSGLVWVTMDGQDIVLKGGDELTLKRGKDHAVISAAGLRPAAFEIR